MVSLHIKRAHSIREKMQGLIGKNKNEAIMLQTRFGIHTFGVKFPIDVVILDSKNKIVALKENLLPNRFFFWKPIYRNVLELPQRTIARKSLVLTSQVKLIIS